MRRSLMSLGLGVILLGLLIAGCARRQQQSQQPTGTQPTASQPTGQVAGSQESANMVPVSLTGQGLTVGRTRVPAGQVTLNITNNSGTARTVQVTGPGNTKQTSESIQPGQSGTVVVQNAQPGSYQVSVPGQSNARGTLSVVPADQAPQFTSVTMAATDQGFTITPSSIPDGDVMITLANQTNAAKTFTFRGQGVRLSPQTVQPGQSATFMVEKTGNNAYTVTLPAASRGGGGG